MEGNAAAEAQPFMLRGDMKVEADGPALLAAFNGNLIILGPYLA
jgi:hypothetical protein